MRNWDRREFLFQSMLASAAASAGIPAISPLKAEEKRSVNDQLRVAVLGVNGRGKTHLTEFIKNKDTVVATICDPDTKVGQSRCEQAEKIQGTRPKFVQDLREVMDDKTIDIVAIATPNHWHSLAAIWAMQAGKQVYVEKPVSHNVSEGRRAVQAARKYQKVCQTGTQSRSSNAIQQAVEYIQGGNLGELLYTRGLCNKRRNSIGKVDAPTPIPSEIDYNLWCGPAEKKPLMRKKLHYDWHWQWNCGNGDLGNQGIHQMDIARWFLGQDALADEVVTVGGRFGYVDDGETPNTEITFLKYGDRQLVFEVRGLPSKYLKGVRIGDIIECENGYAVIPSNYGSVTIFDKDGKKTKEFKGGGNHFTNFVEAVKNNKPGELNADIEEGHLSSALCHLGNISYRLGTDKPVDEAAQALSGNDVAMETLERTKQHLKENNVDLSKTNVRVGERLKFDPKTETFAENSAANAMLTRPYRKPFVVPEEKDL